MHWHRVLLSLFLGLSQTLAHSHPKTEHEIEVQRALQAAAYYVSLFFSFKLRAKLDNPMSA